MTSKVCDAATAVALIRDGQSVASTGVIGWSTPDTLLAALGQRHRRTREPRDLTFFFPVATGDAMGIRGMDHVATTPLMRRIIAGSYINPIDPKTGRRPELMRLIQADEVEAYSWPIGATMHWLREVARRSPGYLTRVGLETYIDPRMQGGKLTARATEDLVHVVALRGEELLFYPTFPLDVGFVRASSSDDLGNLSFERDPLMSCSLALAMAVKASGGTVIAQVGNLVERGDRAAHDVRVPGDLVDHVVLDETQVMTTDVVFDPAYLQCEPTALGRLPRLPSGPDKVVARRVARELRPHETTIFGFGASSDAVLVMAEDGALTPDRLHDFSFTTEHGAFGGIVMGGWQFSANVCPTALLDGVSQFDFIDGGGCKVAALSFAQLDRSGNVNVSKFGRANPGAGGFIDIAQNAERLIFAGTFTTGGLDAATDRGRLTIRTEGAVRKFVDLAEHVTYRVARGVARGQAATIVTERAVFEVRPDGLVLTEVAPGVDVQHHIAEQMDFPFLVAEPLLDMDPTLFAP